MSRRNPGNPDFPVILLFQVNPSSTAGMTPKGSSRLGITPFIRISWISRLSLSLRERDSGFPGFPGSNFCHLSL